MTTDISPDGEALPPSERALFEQWADATMDLGTWEEDGTYHDTNTSLAWKAWSARAVFAAPQNTQGDVAQAQGYAPAAPSAGLRWPEGRDVARCGDMTPLGDSVLRIVLDSDNDVCVEAWGSLEFCNGGGGGGQSPNTRAALIALMAAMEQDNAEKPRMQWPQRTTPKE
jgi:hypothetical protein